MPLYDVECKTCAGRDTVFRKIDERDLLPVCACGGELFRVITAPMLNAVMLEPFVSPGTGEVIDSRTKYKEDLRRSGAIPWEPGLKEEIARNKVHEQEKAFAPIAAEVDKYVAAAVAAGKLET
jgi:putative FmdB family regulatory protein